MSQQLKKYEVLLTSGAKDGDGWEVWTAKKKISSSSQVEGLVYTYSINIYINKQLQHLIFNAKLIRM